jgi:hypothetical protein
MKVSILHNVTEEDGRLAIFSRFSYEPRIQPGDRLQLVGVLDFPDDTTAEQAAELAFEAGNSPADIEAVKEYRSWKVRSLSVGDVVAVEDDNHAMTALGCESVGFAPVDLAQFTLVDAVIVSLRIENRYMYYGRIDTTVADVVVPTPPANEDSQDYADWAYDNIYCCYTGVGHTDGDSWYDVEITASSDPALVGRTLQWGY